MDAENFSDWLGRAKPGERFTYFHGDLAKTRGDGELAHQRLEEIANAQEAFTAEMAGKVHLVQRRLGPGTFEYVAIRRRNAA